MAHPDSNTYNKVRQRLLSCICVSHGIVIDHNVFMNELEYTLSRVLACFFSEVDVEHHGAIQDALRLEFQALSGAELKQLVIQELSLIHI